MFLSPLLSKKKESLLATIHGNPPHNKCMSELLIDDVGGATSIYEVQGCRAVPSDASKNSGADRKSREASLKPESGSDLRNRLSAEGLRKVPSLLFVEPCV